MMRGYYFITDSGLSRAGSVSDVRDAVEAGVCAVQYRSKDNDSKQLFEEAFALRALCRGTKTLFLLNDRVDVALAVDADGVHLGQDDLPYLQARRLLGKNKVIGITVHSVDEALIARDAGADYLGVSPIFSTTTKTDAGKPSGIALIRDIRSRVSLPLVAIGGITLANAPDVAGAGADGLCAISAVVAARDVKAEIRKFQKLFGV